MMGDFGGAFGWGFGGSLMMIIFWGAIILLIVWLIKSISENSAQSKSPLETLKIRYAKGEIDKKEFEDKKKDLI